MEKEEKKFSYRFYTNKDCQFFPCHETKDLENFNCLFCYCPLYALGDKCGGNFTYLESGIKDCSKCLVPHNKNGYDYITSKYYEIMLLAKRDKTKKEMFEIIHEMDEEKKKNQKDDF